MRAVAPGTHCSTLSPLHVCFLCRAVPEHSPAMDNSARQAACHRCPAATSDHCTTMIDRLPAAAAGVQLRQTNHSFAHCRLLTAASLVQLQCSTQPAVQPHTWPASHQRADHTRLAPLCPQPSPQILHRSLQCLQHSMVYCVSLRLHAHCQHNSKSVRGQQQAHS